jgi:hypothetical protein
MTNQVPSFGITNIPVYVNGQFVYSPAVNRLLQLTANIYDATTSRYYDPVFSANTIPLPTLFQPIFRKFSNGTSFDVYIGGFQELTGNGALGSTLTNTPIFDLDNPNDLANLLPFNFVYGVPIIVGAKKGLPNFEQFAMQSMFQLTRKLQLTRPTTNDYPNKLNQMFSCSVSNQFEVQCWNSYYTNYTRPTILAVADKIQMVLTNDEISPALGPWYTLNTVISNSVTVANWTGTGMTDPTKQIPNPNSFQIPFNANAILLPPAVYQFAPQFFTTNLNAQFENTIVGYPQPHWGLLMTNNVQIVLIDQQSGRAIDYVQLRGPKSSRDLTAEILATANSANPPQMWLTNFVSSGILTNTSLPYGVENQLQDSKVFNAVLWTGQSQPSVQPQIDGFNRFISNTHDTNGPFGETNLAIQAAYTPTATVNQFVTWQANDPLVHYMSQDLFDSENEDHKGPQTSPINPLISTSALNERYQPWGLSKQMANSGNADGGSVNLAFKDPLMWSSDYWDFPTNKYPTVGWLGRVHRGTPWQTVYLKAFNVLNETNTAGTLIGVTTWTNWTGNINAFDSVNAAPGQDVLLFDLFTTAPNDNATHGQLSVNAAVNTNDPAAGLAAWSALLSGVIVLSNNATDFSPPNPFVLSYHVLHPFQTVPTAAFPVNPAGQNGLNSLLGQIVTNINYARATFTNIDGIVGTFEHVGDILHTPKLSDHSPFLNLSTAIQLTNGISDEMYEWMPQQAMSLLRANGAPRYVIYSYGQTLKPAPGGIVTSGGGFFGMVTNYQITAETATRTVVRVDGVTDPVDGTPLKPPLAHPHIVIESFNILPPD